MKKAFLLLVFISAIIQAQASDMYWTKTFGGASNDFGNIAEQTIDGGFIIGGSTQSFGSGQSDIWLIRTDENGDSLWSTTLGDNNSEGGGFVQQTQDGGYIVAGTIRDSIYNYSVSNIWLIKTDENGDSLWSTTLGDNNSEGGGFVQQTQDGGYIVAGTIRDSIYNYSVSNIWLIKTANGDSIWSNTYGGLNDESSAIVQQTQDGGYLIGATTKSYGEGGDDMWLIKTNDLGDTLWTKTIGSAENERTKDIIESTDGGYIIIGTIPHFDWGMQSMIGMYKFNEYGESVEWNWTLGVGTGSAGKIESTQDGGYIILGYTPMQGGNTPFLSKLNSDGSENWSTILEGNLNTVKQTNISS
jgi:TolB-like protein